MNNALFKDTQTQHRVLIGNKKRIVYARHDHEGNFVRYVLHLTASEIETRHKAYLPARVGIPSWIEVFKHNFIRS